MTEEEKLKTRTQKLKYLIECLEDEMPQYKNYAAPENAAEAFNLFRALCNVREPRPGASTMHTLPENFYKTESEVLKEITEEKGITDAKTLAPSKLDPRLSLWQGDITTLKADAIVNAANSQLLGCFAPLHACIDNCIHTMAGVELREKCYEIMVAQGKDEETGKAKITPGYNLPSRSVIHTVGPIVGGILTSRDKILLASCYNSVLNLAGENDLESVAFCCISTGVFHFPPEKAAKIAVETTQKWLGENKSSSVKKVIFNVFKDSDKEIYKKILE